jgi:presenilin-like A22 family membrane protease
MVLLLCEVNMLHSSLLDRLYLLLEHPVSVLSHACKQSLSHLFLSKLLAFTQVQLLPHVYFYRIFLFLYNFKILKVMDHVYLVLLRQLREIRPFRLHIELD